ncbi:hypothetical protein [Leptolyngbya sp. KIOST-1]|uniref:hypothetical protein n=1 Tax=Leptolyngbya sp. KIOST-1 TaxID=1229172 RepID=UPI0005663516
MTTTLQRQQSASLWEQFCQWVTSTENRLYVGWFGVLPRSALARADQPSALDTSIAASQAPVEVPLRPVAATAAEAIWPTLMLPGDRQAFLQAINHGRMPRRLTARTIWAAATSASWRCPIGVVPAWLGRPVM